ncbi:MAG: hypothetical protein HC806_08065, partial [Anaerolineae bacterium]|nr:hypothetical protein [Anaerolineae bacterium]
MESANKISATLSEQRKLVETLARQLTATQQRGDELRTRLGERAAEQQTLARTLSRAEDIQTAFQAWQDARGQLTAWDETATRFREHEASRNEPLTIIREERASLEKELENLLQQQTEITNLQPQIS